MGIIVIIIIMIVLYWQVKSIFHNKAKLAKTIIVLLLLIFISSSSYASNEFTCVFTLINPSATNVAFGLNSGTANIWDRNPLGVWSNPAKLGYYKGFAYGNSHDPWFDEFISGIYHNSSYLTLEVNGIGFLFPYTNRSNRMGTTIDYGEQITYDVHGNLLIKFNSYETCSQFAFGINSLEFANKLFDANLPITSLQKYSELSFGYSLDYIQSNLYPYITDSLIANNRGAGFSHNIGVIIKITPLNIDNENIRIDITAGINIVNIFKSDMTFKYDNGDKEKQPLPYGNRTGVAGNLSFIKIQNLPQEFNNLKAFSKNLFTILASYDNSKYADNPSTWGKGIELTLLDIFSWRYGNYSDKHGHIVGDCKGWGVNLNYKNIVGFQYNYVEFPGGELQHTQEKNDVSFNVDIIKLINELK